MDRLLSGIQRLRPLWEFFAVVVATTTLVFGVYQYNSSLKTEKKAAAVRYATEFVSSPEFIRLQADIRNLALVPDKDKYFDFNLANKNSPDGKKLKDSIVALLNELEIMAYAVNNDVFDETIVKPNFDELVFIHGTAHLFGHGNSTDSCSWADYKNLTPLFPDPSEYPELKKLYLKWFPHRNWPGKV